MLNKFQIDTINRLQSNVKNQILLVVAPFSDERENIFTIAFPIENNGYQHRILYINSFGQVSIHLFPTCNPEEYKNFIFNRQTVSPDFDQVMQLLQLTNNPNSLKNECLKFIKANLDNRRMRNIENLTGELKEELKRFNL